MIPPAKPQAGISLVETMIALFVIALLAAAGGTMLTQSLRGARVVEDRSAHSKDLLIALAVVRDDFAAFVDRPSRNDASGGFPLRFEGKPVRDDAAIVSFIRNGWPNPDAQPRGDLQRVEYVYRDGDFIRRSWSAPDPGPGTAVSEQALLSGIERMSVRYGQSKEWKSDWVVVSDAQNRLFPDKVEFVFSFAEDDAITAKFRLGLRP